MNTEYVGLEVDPGQDGLHLAYGREGLQAVYEQSIQEAKPVVGAQSPEPTIVRVKKVTFWLSVTVLVAVIVAAIAGATGGSVAAKRKRELQTLQAYVSGLLNLSIVCP